MPAWRPLVFALTLGTPLLVLAGLTASDGPTSGPTPRPLTARSVAASSSLLPVPVQPSHMPSRAVIEAAAPTVYLIDIAPEPVAPASPPPPDPVALQALPPEPAAFQPLPPPQPAAFQPPPPPEPIAQREAAPRQSFRSGRAPAWEPPERLLP